MIFMVYRHLDGLPESRSVMGFSGGEASLGYARTWDPYFEPTEIDVDGGTRHIGNGHPYFGDPGSGVTTVIAGYGDSWFGYTPYRVAIHELSRYWMMDGTDYGHHGDGFWAMLNSFGARFNSQNVSCVNSFERELLGWIAPDSLYQTTYSITLRDYITTGDAVKIKVPGGNPNEVFRLEYHQKLSSFDNPEMGDPDAKGLYILDQTGKNDPYTQLRLLPADGRWIWTADEVVFPPYYGGGLAVYERSNIDRVNGYDDSRLVPFTWIGPPPSPSVPNPMLIHPFRDKSKSTYPLIDQDPRIFRGDGKDAFGLTKCNIFSPWSNPNTQNDAKASTGVAVEITGENAVNHTVTFNLYFSSTLAQALAPSKPQNVQVGYNPSNQAVVTWAANVEPDVTTGGGYDVYRAVYWGTTLSYTKINTALVTSTYFTDTPPVPTGAPFGAEVWYRYQVKAKDSQNKYSLPSEDFWLYGGKAVSGTAPTATWSGQYIATGTSP